MGHLNLRNQATAIACCFISKEAWAKSSYSSFQSRVQQQPLHNAVLNQMTKEEYSSIRG